MGSVLPYIAPWILWVYVRCAFSFLTLQTCLVSNFCSVLPTSAGDQQFSWPFSQKQSLSIGEHWFILYVYIYIYVWYYIYCICKCVDIYIHTTYTYAQYTQQICSIMQDKSLAPLPSRIYIYNICIYEISQWKTFPVLVVNIHFIVPFTIPCFEDTGEPLLISDTTQVDPLLRSVSIQQATFRSLFCVSPLRRWLDPWTGNGGDI